jgi:hypothetical protein
MLYYFKSPDDVQKPNGLRGTINMADCVVEDLDERGAVRPQVGGGAGGQQLAWFYITCGFVLVGQHMVKGDAGLTG